MKLRGTALIFRDNRVLLVRNNLDKPFNLPGGGIQDMRDPPLSAACREVSKQLELEALSATRLPSCDCPSKYYFHKVVLVEVGEDTQPYLCERVKDYIWWDGKEPIERFEFVDEILAKYNQ